MPRLVSIAVCLAVAAAPAVAAAQVDRRFAEEPTGGVDLPATPLAGTQDARATVVNPAGLHFLGGPELILAIDADAEDEARTAGPGVGLYVAQPLGVVGKPWLGLGVGVEWLRPSRLRLLPDPGSPLRLTLSTSTALGRHAALGVAWHHFSDDGAIDGLDTADLGLSWRLGNRLAVGAVVRDVGAPSVGDVPVQRRYELELTGRPLGTDRLDLGLGGRIGERRADVDGWLRVSARLTRGVYAHLAAETRELQVVDLTPSGGQNQFEDRDLRVVAGLELSFGATGVTAYGAAGVDEDGAGHLSGATIVLRASTQQVPPVQGHATRLERVDLQGAIGAREAARLVLRLRAMARDPDVAGLVLAIDGITAGWGTVQELRGEVTRLRAAGKKVFAYLVVGANRDYYLATAADKIYIDPAGGVRLTGLAATTMYFRGAFDMLGVSAQFEKIAEYKSAPESYTDVGPSEPARRMRDELYDSIYDQLVAGIASGRGLDPAVVRQLIEDGPYSAGDLAKDKRLVDAVGVPDEISQQIVVELGASYPVAAAPSERDDRWDRPAVAIIYADGDIVDGKSSEIPLLGRKLVGGETLIGALQAARLDPSIKAIVLRIDSPGGSALASELMAREVFKTRGVKPIICSMGDVAASGGYFLAAGCDKIFAEPMTITGSIGIFYGKFDLSGLIAKLGITTTTFTRGRHADMDGYYRGYTDEERALIQDKLRYLYGRFTGTVAEGRGLTVDQVDQVGRGHVWSGTQARGVGLVDELGGLGDALDYAKAQAGLGAGDRVRVVELPEAGGGLLSKLIGNLLRARAADHVALSDVGLLRQLVRGVPASVLVAPETPQARLPFDITWE